MVRGSPQDGSRLTIIWFVRAKAQRELEFFTSSHDLKVVAINCSNYHTPNLCDSPSANLSAYTRGEWGEAYPLLQGERNKVRGSLFL